MKDYKMIVRRHVRSLIEEGRLDETKGFIQHGSMSVFEHCICVALVSCIIAERLRIKIDHDSLVRGALLHDYFLYDWHEKNEYHRLHGFYHPGIAMKNADADYGLSEKEKDIIKHHMFPLTVVPPMCREAWIVTMADKICATKETYYGFANRFQGVCHTTVNFFRRRIA